MTVCSTTGKLIDPRGVQVAAHYNSHPSGVEAIEFCRYMNFNVGNAFKYLFRRSEKPEEGMTITESTIKNLDKALWYLRDELNHYAGVPSNRSQCPELFHKLIEHEPDVRLRACYSAFEAICSPDMVDARGMLRALVTCIEDLKEP